MAAYTFLTFLALINKRFLLLLKLFDRRSLIQSFFPLFPAA